MERKLTEEQERNIYLRKLLTGEIQGPLTGKPSKDKPHLKAYKEGDLTLDPPKMSMYQYLYELNKNHMDQVAIVFDTGFSETSITYREFFENVDKAAKALIARGIKPGDKIALSMANTPESAYMIYAINKVGAVTCLIDPRETAFNMKRDLKDLDAKMFIGINESYSTLKKVNKEIDLDNIVIIPTINSSNNKMVKNLYAVKSMFSGNVPMKLNRRWSNFLSKSSQISQINLPEKESNKLALISYTGGTTGVHKGVEITDDAMNTLIFSHDFIMEPIHRGDIFMNILPQFMIYGIFTLHLSLCRGLETHMVMDASPEKFVDYLLKLNPAMVFGGPVHWETLIDNPRLNPGCLSNLRAPVSGGEKLPLAKEEKIDEALAYSGAQESICNGFGASELCGSVTLKYGQRNAKGSVGRLHIFDNARIINPATGEEMSYNESGELQVTTPSMMIGYYNNDAETENAICVDEDGTRWFKTGDLAKIDENGDIEITGRSKRLFVCGLNNVYPPAMEEIIQRVPNVKKCVVVGVPDEELRTVPKVHVVLNEDSEDRQKLVQDLIVASISEQMGTDILPKYYSFDDELLYTPNGKVDYVQIQNRDIEQMESAKITQKQLKK